MDLFRKPTVIEADRLCAALSRLTGSDRDALRALYRKSKTVFRLKEKGSPQTAHLLEKAGLCIRGIVDPLSSRDPGGRQWVVRPDNYALARAGLNPAAVLAAIGGAYGGWLATSIQTPEREIFFRVILHPSWRRDISGLSLLRVRNREGYPVPVKQFVSLYRKRVPLCVRHLDGRESILLSANIDSSRTSLLEAAGLIQKHIRYLKKRFPDLRFLIMGEAEESGTMVEVMILAFMLALIGVYCILAILFRSLTQPFLVMLAVVFGLVGIAVAFILHSSAVNMFAFVGIIGLAGIVVNDSLVMIEFINSRVEGSGDIIRTVAAAASLRLRPILLTTVTTAAGLLPAAYGLGGYEASISPMVLAIAWGLIVATVLTLFLLPAFYLIERDVRHVCGRAAARLFSSFFRRKK